jgi:hypothetical protein
MRTIRSILSPLAAVALCAAVAPVRPAAAQAATAVNYTRSLVRGAAADEAAVVRLVAVYEIQAPREAGMPTKITVADSAGQLVASYDLRGGRAARPMTVDVRNEDMIVLRGEVPAGLFTFVLYEQDIPAAKGEIRGSWSLGSQSGELRSVR